MATTALNLSVPGLLAPLSRTLGELRLLGQLVRTTLTNPLDGLPPEIFTAPIHRRRVLRREITYVMDPTLIHEALVTHAESLDKGDFVQRPLRPALGNGLLTAEGADWRWQRRAVAPVFRAATLGAFVPAMVAAAARCRDRLLSLPSGAPVAVNAETMRATFDIIVSTMLSGPGNDPGSAESPLDVEGTASGITAYLERTRWANLATLLALPDWAPFPGKRRSRRIAANLRNRLTGLVAARRAAPGRGAEDLLDILLRAADPETGRRMVDEEITDNLLTFITAGHETTALGLAWALDLLGRHPAIARRVHEEARAADLGNADTLPLTRQVFLEALRLYPAAPLILRRVTQPFTLGGFPGGMALRPGAVLVIPVHAVHRRAGPWPNPHAFDPGRFTPEAERDRPRLAFMPFGAGPRVCIGAGFAVQEATIILATLLRDLRFTPIEPAPPRARMAITLRPERDLLMRVERW